MFIVPLSAQPSISLTSVHSARVKPCEAVLCLDMATSGSQILNETREVVYVDKFSMEQLGQLMTQMDSRLSHIEIFV